MGQCCGKTSTTSQKESVMNLSKSPETPIDPGQKLLFHVILSKFKIRGIDIVSYIQLSTHLRICFSRMDFNTEAATDKSGSNFKDTFEFTHETSKRRMQDEKLVIRLCQGNKVIATSTITLISIAKGPIHQSFPLINRNNEEKGRLVFNAEMNQTTELTLVPHMVRFVLEDPSDGLYNMNLKVHADKTIESKMSHIIERLNFIFDEEDEFESDYIPILKFTTSIENIRTSAIQLRLWKHSHADDTQNTNLHAECWIGITKLFKEDKKNIYHMESSLFVSKEELSTHMADFPDTTTSDHSKFFNEVLWHSGKKVGSVTGKLSLRGLPVIYQMICGVNTENGYVIQDSLLNPKKNYKYAKKELPAEMVKIMTSTEELKMFIRKGRHSAKSEYKDYKAHVNILNEIIDNLEKTDRESMICFIYKDAVDLLKAQKALLDLGELLINYADFIQYDVKPFYFDCLVRLNQRGELGLGYISFINESPNMYQKRKEIAERYLHFLQEMLRFALFRMNFKGIEPKTQKFVENFLAISYFRIPAFRNKLLEVLKSKSYYPVDEWRGITMDLEDDIQDSDLVPALDWPKLFYDLISSDAYKVHCKGLDDDRWQQKISKRGLVFFCFIDEWARHINQEFVRANLPWNHIPGYNVVVKTFLIEMKERKITQYPEALIQASTSLLRNDLLLNVFIFILFRKTNIHDFQSSFDSFNIMNSWFECVYKRHGKLPKNFDVGFFISGIKIALQSQVCLSVAKTIWFIYVNFHIITGNIRKKIIRDILLDEMFETLFFHWSRDVRKMFYCLLMYRILSLTTVNFESTKLASRDKKLIQMTENKMKAEELKVKSATSPLMKTAIKDFLQVKEGYSKWLESVNLGLDESTSNIFKQYKVFPYPTYNIVNYYQDFSEKKIEEW